MVNSPFNLETYILFLGGGSVDSRGVVVVVIVSPKEEERQFVFQGVSNDYE